MNSKVFQGIPILFLFSGILSHAQGDPNYKCFDDQPNIKISYNSSLIYPGISTGFEIPMPLIKVRKLIKNPDGKAFNKDWFISGNFNWYHHPEFHDNLYLTTEWVRRRTKSTGTISEFSFGPGFSRTFLGGTTYTLSNNGSISVVKRAGYNYALLTVGLGYGYDYSIKRYKPFLIFAKGNMLVMFPYNSTIYIRPVLELGVRYAPAIRESKKQRQLDSITKRK